MSSTDGKQLIRELLADPRRFDDKGRSYALLQAYFGGLPLESLRPLLRSDDVFVQRAAAFVASELGSAAGPVVDDVIPLLASSDRHVPYYAMEVVAVCCEGELAEGFAHVVRMLTSEDEVLRRLAMRLVSNADKSQLAAVLDIFESGDSTSDRLHVSPLSELLKGPQLEPADVLTMIYDEKPLIRIYGAIAAKRLLGTRPELIVAAAVSSDLDVRRFAEEAIQGRGSHFST